MSTVTQIKEDVYNAMVSAGWLDKSNPDLALVHTHNDILIENILSGQVDPIVVNSFHNPESGIPEDPAVGDRYIASATANGWTKDNIYEWAGDAGWVTVEFRPGRIVHITTGDEWYGSESSGWVSFGTGVVNGTPERVAIFDADGRIASSLIRKNGLLYELIDNDGYEYLAFGRDGAGNRGIRSDGYVGDFYLAVETGTPGVYHKLVKLAREWDSTASQSIYRAIIDGRLTVQDVPPGDGTVALFDASGKVVKGNLRNDGDVTVVDGPFRAANVPDISGTEIGSVALLDENGNLRRGAIYQSETELQIVDNNDSAILTVDLDTGYSRFGKRLLLPNLSRYYGGDVVAVDFNGRVVKTSRVDEWEVRTKLTIGDDAGTPGMQANIADFNSTDIQLKKPTRLLSVAAAESASTVLTRVEDEVQEVPVSALGTEMSDADFLAKMKSMLKVEHPLKLVEVDGKLNLSYIETFYEWNWGDNTVSHGKTSSHIYAEAGTYYGKLSVTEDGYTSVRHFTVLVTDAGNEIVWDDVVCTWDWGDGTPQSVGRNAEHTYQNSGTYYGSVTTEYQNHISIRHFTVRVSTGEPIEFEWTCGNGDSGTGREFETTLEHSHTVELTVRDEAGNEAVDSWEIYVTDGEGNELPPPEQGV